MFASSMRSLRLMRNLSQEKLAELCDVHRTYIGSVERGECNISIDNMDRIAKGLGVTVVDMLREGVALFAIYCVRCGASLTVVTHEQSIVPQP